MRIYWCYPERLSLLTAWFDNIDLINNAQQQTRVSPGPRMQTDGHAPFSEVLRRPLHRALENLHGPSILSHWNLLLYLLLPVVPGLSFEQPFQ